MENYLKTYKLKFHTIGPVFIGSGDKIGKKDYIKSGTVAYIPDPMKMHMGLKKMGLTESFENFYMYGKDYKYNLSNWIRENHIPRKDYEPWISYSLNFADVTKTEKPANEIMTFVKDAYGRPYIPGSSIKGALRTVLLEGLIRNNQKIADKFAEQIQTELRKNREENYLRGDKKLLKKETEALEARFFNQLKRNEEKRGDARNDVMAGIIISDSKPLSISDLVLCQKIDINTENKKNPLPILRECIKPGIDIECTITIDTQICKIFNANGILRAVNESAEFYNKTVRRHFKLDSQNDSETGIIYIGGGSGYWSKTVTYAIFNEVDALRNTVEILRRKMGEKNFKMHKHDYDASRGISPHTYKVTCYNGDIVEFGKCKMSMSK